MRSHSPRAPPPEARARSHGPPSSDELERVAQAERNALEHRPDECAAVVTKLETREGRARRRVCMRRPLPREVGSEEKPVDAGAPGFGLGDEVGEGRFGGEPVAQPLQRAGRREHHPHRVPLAGDRVTERVDARLRIARERGQRRKHDARRAHHDRERTRPVDTHPESRRRAVPGTRRNRDPWRQIVAGESGAGDLGRFEERRQNRGIEVEGAQHLGRPAAAGDVEQERARRVGDVRRPLSRESQPYVILRQHDPRDPPVLLRLVAAEPEQLRCGEARQRPISRERDQSIEPDALLDLGALDGCPLVIPEDRGPDDPPRCIESDEAVHLTREADPADLERSELCDRSPRRDPPVLGVLLRPAGPWSRERIPTLRAADDLTVWPDGNCLDSGRADIETDDDSGSVSCHGRDPIRRTVSGAGPPITRSGGTRSAASTTRRPTQSS